MLSLKVNVFVYESYSHTEYSIDHIVPSDVEEIEVEEREIEELQDHLIMQIRRANTSSALAMLLTSQSFSEKYNSRHQDFTTPPPKQG